MEESLNVKRAKDSFKKGDIVLVKHLKKRHYVSIIISVLDKDTFMIKDIHRVKDVKIKGKYLEIREEQEINRPEKSVIYPGDIFKTVSGRSTTQYPYYSLKKTYKKDIIALYNWFIDNAILEAMARDDNFNKMCFSRMRPEFCTWGDIDMLDYYLFNDNNFITKSNNTYYEINLSRLRRAN